jgi:hypothetical protein
MWMVQVETDLSADLAADSDARRRSAGAPLDRTARRAVPLCEYNPKSTFRCSLSFFSLLA